MIGLLRIFWIEAVNQKVLDGLHNVPSNNLEWQKQKMELRNKKIGKHKQVIPASKAKKKVKTCGMTLTIRLVA